MIGRLTAAVSIATLALVGATNSLGAGQSEPGTAAGIGFVCAYLNSSLFSTLVVNVESTGLQEASVTRGMSCATAFAVLTDRGFELVDASSTVATDFNGDRIVDAADYVVWRKTSGKMPRTNPGTIVITACAHFGDPAIRTELIGVEHGSSQQLSSITGVSCAAAFNTLMDRGFTLLHKGPTVIQDSVRSGGTNSWIHLHHNVWRANQLIEITP